MFHEVLFPGIRTDPGHVQSKETAVTGTALFHDPSAPDLAVMKAEGIHGYLHACEPVEAGEGDGPVHEHLLFLPEMYIEFLHLPGSVFLGTGRILGRGGSHVHRLDGCVRRDLMARVPVLSMDVMRDHHARTVSAELTDNGAFHGIPAPAAVLCIHGGCH